MAKHELFGSESSSDQGPVECLGMTFPNDEARRSYFTEKLREKLKDQAFREIEGFPIGEDEDILALSDPPYYTACPNPFVEDIIRHYGRPYDPKETYSIKPFAFDVTEGRHTWLYKAHTYHTKVPPKAIVRFIEHYTRPGDIVFDGFGGSGMTAVAASMADPPRTSFTSDLSPAASFIASTYLMDAPVDLYEAEAYRIADQLDAELGWMYRPDNGTTHPPICNYYVWSDVFLCSGCGSNIVFWDSAFDKHSKKFSDRFECPECGAENSKRSERAQETIYDHVLRKPWTRYKQVPVLAVVSLGNRRATKRAVNDSDIALLKKVRDLPPSSAASRLAVKMLFRDGQWGDQWKSCLHLRPVTHAHQLFAERQLHYVARFLEMLDLSRPDHRALLFTATSVLQKTSRLMVYNADGIGRVQKGTLYISSVGQEMRFSHMLRIAVADMVRASREGMWTILPERRVKSGASRAVWAGSATQLPIPDSSIDYVFVDPPFGANIPYSELNFLWESLLGVFTDSGMDAVQSSILNKSLADYQAVMESSFREFFRILKPSRWITVEFHNSKNAVWTAIQEALMRAGFVIADVRVLDKKQLSFKQATTAGAVKQDLVITAYRPSGRLEQRFELEAGTEEGVWNFVRTHLDQLPVFVSSNDCSEILAERQNFLLFDRMVAFHVQRGHSIPLSAAEFYAGLRRLYSEEDGMYFLPDQVTEYKRRRLEVKEVEQLQFFVSDEKSAIQWVRAQLSQEPLSFKNLQPIYMREAQKVWEKHEHPVELRTILEQNFVQDDDGTWRVPDPRKESDLEQVRHGALMKEFHQYFDAKGKLKLIRTEALRAGFKESWQKKDYTTIVQMAKRVPEAVIQEDSALLMYLDNASLMLGE